MAAKTKGTGKPQTIAALARHFEKSRATISNWLEQGMPRTSIAAAQAWHDEREKVKLERRAAKAAARGTIKSISAINADDRWRIARAEAKELEVAIKRGQLVSREDVERAIEDRALLLVRAFDRLCDRIPQRFPEIAHDLEDRIRHECDLIFEEWSTAPKVKDAPEADTDDDDADDDAA